MANNNKKKQNSFVAFLDKSLQKRVVLVCVLVVLSLLSSVLVYFTGNYVGLAVSKIDYYEQGAVELETASNTTMTGSYAFRNWDSFNMQDMYYEGNSIYAVDGNTYSGEKVVVSKYSKSYSLQKTYEFEYKEYGASEFEMYSLSFKYGAFQGGKNYNYLVLIGPDLGSYNYSEYSEFPALRVVKLDKNFKEVEHIDHSYASMSSASRPGGFSKVSIAESDDGSEIAISTGRDGTYDSSGIRHQIGVQLIIKTEYEDTKNMKIVCTNPIWVTHSLGQHVVYDGSTRIFTDAADASPCHGIVLTKIEGDDFAKTSVYPATTSIINHYVYMNMNIGGVVASEDNYLVAYNTMDETLSADTGATHNSASTEIRDIRVVVANKEDISDYKIVTVHDYISTKTDDGGVDDDTRTGGEPYIVKLSNDNYMVIWQEYIWTGGESFEYQTTCYTIIDGDGNIVQKVIKDDVLWLNCWSEPLYDEKTNAVYWYIDKNNDDGITRNFFKLKVKV